jgi:3-hydroxyisobutyrate dehydrogenase-like beta-hydroxyacid dehydrogenase
MGKPMATNLLARDHRLVVHSRSPAPVEAVVAAGAERADSPADVARRATRIFLMLPDAPDVEQVLEGPGGVFSAIQPGTVIIDCSTIAPSAARRLAARAAALGAAMLDAPVSGGEIGAVNASLSIMVGGDAATFDAVRPLLEAVGNPERIVRIGEAGAGQICKACNQLVIGGTLAAVAEAFTVARKAGIDPARVREALLGGFAASRVLEIHGQRILDGNYTPGFRAALYAKDYRIVRDTLHELGIDAPVTTTVARLVTALGEARGEADYAALATVLFGMNGLD